VRLNCLSLNYVLGERFTFVQPPGLTACYSILAATEIVAATPLAAAIVSSTLHFLSLNRRHDAMITGGLTLIYFLHSSIQSIHSLLWL